jgi:rubrerythrin
MDIERYLDVSKRVDLNGIDFDAAAKLPVNADEIRCLTYMMDVESHTIVYLRGLLNTCAIEDPEIAAFLSCWAYEEFFHGRALRQLLRACGTAQPAPLATRVTFQELATGFLCRFTPHLSAAYLTWGAVQELSTLEGYGLLARRTQNPVLAELLRRIIKDERRHFSFYYNKARAHLKARGAQRLTSFLIRRFWTPVGEGVKAHEETNWMLQFLFSDAYGRKAAERIDSTMRQLPGLEWFDMLSSKVSSVLDQAHRSDPPDPQYRWKAATDYLKYPPRRVEQE